MRLAWHGPTPTDDGVGYAATLLLGALHDAGVEIDCFLSSPGDVVPDVLRKRHIRFTCIAPRWEWDRWYSRTPLSAFVTGQAARAAVQRLLVREIARRHVDRRYDVLYQFSQIESFGTRSIRDRLPPIVLHPEVHIAGELTWHRRESAMARACEPLIQHRLARMMLIARSARQRRDIKFARLVIAPSRRFATHLQRDYGVAEADLAVVANPIDLSRFVPLDDPGSRTPLELLFVSRMAVRKGVEMVVELSERLKDLAGIVRITAVGGPSLFSDYRPLLSRLNPAVAQYVGHIDSQTLPELYRESAALLQPSHYEPFALTVAEALASGIPVVASDEVGATEQVSERVCRTFPSGDMNKFEATVRGLISELSSLEKSKQLATTARSEAERLFDPDVVARQLVACLETARGSRHQPEASRP